MMIRRYQIRVTGRVQGVGFRQATLHQALQLGLTGWVHNLPDPRQVAIEAEGEDSQLDKFLIWLQEGPRFARVDTVWHAPMAPQHEPTFRILED
ncbi:MAG: acylphosphatase [Sulfobacillus sp.]|nr:acylphosphatase [Sulfobacillus sp.]